MAKIKLRRDTAANWSNPSNNPILASGEPGYETDTGKLKIGNGSTVWNSLPYFDDQESVLSAVTQDIIPDQDNTYDLGSPSNQWRDIYVSNGSIYLGDVKLSNESGQLVVQQVTDPGLETEAPVPDTPGSVTTDRLVNGENSLVILSDGTLELNGDAFTGGGSSDRLVNGSNEIVLGADGTISLPELNNTGYEPFYTLNGPTLKLGESTSQTIITGPTPTLNNPNAQRIVIQGQKGFGGNNTAGEGGDVYIWGGVGGEYTEGAPTPGNGGDIKVRGGAGQFGGDGGYVRVEGGDSFYGPGGSGGFVEITGGNRVDGGNGDGGDVTIKAGVGLGTGNDGEIHLYTNGTNNHWHFDNGGNLTLPVGGDIKDSNGDSILSNGIQFDADDAINLQGNGIIRNQADSQNINIVANGFAQLQWTTDAGVAESDPNDTNELLNWLFVDEVGVTIETNRNGEGNTYEWHFDTQGKLHLPIGGDIVDNNGDSVLDSNIILTSNEEIRVTVGNTEYFAIVNRANNNNNGVESSAVEIDSNGNIVMLHISEIDDGVDIFNRLIISKFSSTGNLLWQKQIQENIIGNTQDADISQGHDIVIDSSNNILVIYNQNNAENGDDSLVVIKLNGANGNEQWKKLYYPNAPYTATENILFSSSILNTGTFEGNPVDVASTDGDYTYLNSNTGWILEESSNGGTTWTTLNIVVGITSNAICLPENSGVTLNLANLYRLARTATGNSFVEAAGSVTDNTHTYIAARYDSPNVNGDVTYLIKIVNSNGNLVWAQSIEYTAGESDEAYGIDLDGEGNIVIAGASRSPGPIGGYVSKFSGSDGSHIWTRVFTDINIMNTTSGDVVVDSQNNIFVSLNSRQEIVHDDNNNYQTTIAHVIKLNSSGSTQWIRRIGPGPCASVGTGIDCDSDGNVYLSALTVVQDKPTRELNDWGNTARSVLALAKYSTTGTVLWQRYIEPAGYRFYQSKDIGDNPPGFYGYDANSGRNLSIGPNGKLAVQVTAKQKDSDGNIYNNDYWESITFQIDQDGREMTVGSGNEKFTVKASRIPGRFVEIPELVGEVPSYSPTITDLTEDISVSIPEITYADGELGNQVSKSESYEYVFGNDGTLTIPNDGDIKLTQTQIGWFSIYGPANNNNNDVWIRANCVDPNTGDVYVVGQDNGANQGLVARYDSTGQIIWSIRLIDDDNGSDSRANAVAIHPDTGNIIVLVEYFGVETNTAIIEIEPDTAKVLRSTGFRDTGNDSGSQGYDLALENGTGRIAVVGRKFDEYKGYSTMPVTGSGVGVMITARAGITDTPSGGNWYVSGTDITGRVIIDSVDRYSGLTTTVREGSGAAFSIVSPGSGFAYVDPPTVWLGSEGTNYLVGHKIKILGTDLGGATPANDAIITVTQVNYNAGGSIVAATISGMSGLVSGGTYNEVTGTNYQVGSGCIMTLSLNTDGTVAGVYAFTEAGSNYVVGDVITVSGTQFPGGASPTNDITMTVSDNSGGGVGGVNGTNNIAGTAPTTYWRIETTSQTPDFANLGGSWTLLQPLGGEAFVVVGSIDPEGDFVTEWSKVLSAGGEYDTDRYFSVAYDSSNNLYAAGEMYATNNVAGATLDELWCAVISKFDNAGNHVWTKALNTTNNNAYAKGVAVRGNSIVVSHYENFYTIITKLDNTGSIKWQRRTESNDDSSVAIDTNGDIYAVMESQFENRYENIIKVIKFESNGEIEWRKFFGTLTYDYGGTDEYFKNGRNLTIDADHLYVSGYTTAFNNNYENGFLVKIPKTGDADGSYGAWALQTETYDVDPITSTEVTTFEPNVGTGDFEDIGFAFISNWFDPSGSDYYQTLEEIVDRDGGAIEFADGTRQTSSAQQIPQVKISNGADHRLKLEDMGKHIFVQDDSTSIIIPYSFDVPLPIGFTVVVVNDSGGTINIDADGGLILIRQSTTTSNYWNLDSYGIATLIKVDTDYWYISGNVTNDSP